MVSLVWKEQNVLSDSRGKLVTIVQNVNDGQSAILLSIDLDSKDIADNTEILDHSEHVMYESSLLLCFTSERISLFES